MLKLSLSSQAFISISALLAAATASPQLLAGHGLGHGVGIGHGVGVGHAVAHAVPVAHAVAHPIAHAVAEVYPDEISPYTYQYAVADDYSGSRFDAQESDDGTAARQGHYSVNLPDGRVQHVNYHANDIDGYVAEVTYDGTAAFPTAVAGHGIAHGGVVGHGVVGHGVVGHGVVGHGVVGHGVGIAHGGVAHIG